MLKWGYCYNQCLLDTAWIKVKSNDNMISCTVSISVNTSCSRCDVLVLNSCIMTHLHYVLWTYFLWALHIYSIDTILYSYTLPIDPILYLSQVFV